MAQKNNPRISLQAQKWIENNKGSPKYIETMWFCIWFVALTSKV